MNSTELAGAIAEYESLFRKRTPAKNVRHVLAGQRVNRTDIVDWYHRVHGKSFTVGDWKQVAAAVKPVLRRLRKAFPSERWS